MIGTVTAAIIVVVALVVLLVLKKRKRGPQKEKGAAVAITHPDEIKALKKNFTSPPSRMKMTNSQLIQMAQEQQGVRSTPPVSKSVIPLVHKESTQEKEPERPHLAADPLKVDLGSRPAPLVENKSPAAPSSDTIADNLKAAKWQKAQETIERLEQENLRLKALSETAPTLKEAASADATSAPDLDGFKKDNIELKRQVNDERSRFEELDKKFSVFKTEFDHMKSLEWAKEEALQAQILKLKEENETLSKTKEAMERRKAEFESLQDIKRQKDSELQKLHDELNAIKTNHIALTGQYKDSQQKAQKLQEDLDVTKLTLEQKLSDTTDRLMSLQNARENAKENELNAQERGVLVQLREENEKLSKTSESIKGEFAKIKDMNEQLREREKVLQYELTKSRAQSIGLEKICEDFKEQIETMNKAPNES